MPDQQSFYNSYIKPFRLVENLELECGYEKSFKLTNRHLLRNRYLLGIDKSLLDHQKLALICEQMEMPEKFVDQLFNNIADANLVLLGFEQGIEDCTYKVYLEYWDKIQKKISGRQPPHEPATLLQGFKWNALDNSQAVLTDYVCYPMLEVDEIIRRIDGLATSSGDHTVFDIANEIVSMAAGLADGQSFVYLEASEAGNPRKSFDVNLYQADMTLKSIYPLVARLFQHYQITPEEFDLLYDELGSRPLGHLSGGTDRSGKNFFTVYYENQPQ